MKVQNSHKKESRTLGDFVRAKLSCSLASFAKDQKTPVSTLNDRWKSASGKVRIMDTVFRVYVDQFGGL